MNPPATPAVTAPRGGVHEVTEEVDRLWEDAVANAGGMLDRRYLVAGLPMVLRFAGAAMLERVAAPLAHLQVEDGAGQEALTVKVWDSASTATPTAPLPQLRASAPSGAKYHFADEGVHALYQGSSGALSVLDGPLREAWYWCADAGRMPDWEASAPIRQILHWWLPQHGLAELHAGAIGTASAGVLIVGRSGVGKSTTSLSSVGFPGLRYAGDDYVAVRIDPTPVAFSLYSSGKLEPHHARLFPHLAAAVANRHGVGGEDEDKAVFHVHERFPESTIASFPLKAILLPRITSSKRPRMSPVSPTVALAALAPSTLLQQHPPDTRTWAVMAELVRRVPSIALELGSDVGAIPQTILDFLENGI